MGEAAKALLAEITTKKWWQGSVISGCELPSIDDGHGEIEWWVIASQACNLYNGDFQKIPVFELVAARRIVKLDPHSAKGDNPRILHVEARSEREALALELDIQKRRWLPRRLLAQLSTPTFHVRDTERALESERINNQWLDNLAGWLARSYTRVALPDEFNDALDRSRLKDVLHKVLKDYQSDLYGVYFLIDSDIQGGWGGRLGEMPPPYNLEIMLVTYETVDQLAFKKKLLDRIFTDEIKDPCDETKKLPRSELARRHGIRVIQAGIETRNVTEISLAELMDRVRYSLVDHLSDSSMAAA